MTHIDRLGLILLKLCDDLDVDAALQDIVEVLGLEAKYPVGTRVFDQYGNAGSISECYISWEDLKDKNNFITIDADRESEKMDIVEMMINGDPRDKWLDMQDRKFSNDEIDGPWYLVILDSGGSIWSSENRLSRIA